MGGTFDPIHNGHLVAASEVADLFDLDEVVFVPTGQPWQKSREVTAPEDRYLMTVIATASNPPRFSVSRVDIDRGGPTYTSDTLRDLRALNPDADLYFITGADALASILSWQNWEELFALAKFVGVSRPGYELNGQHIVAAFDQLPEEALSLVSVPALAISSTDCRLRAAKNRPIWYLVPDASCSTCPNAGCTATWARPGLPSPQSRRLARDRVRRSRPDGRSGRPGRRRQARAGRRRDRRVRPAGDHRLLRDRLGVQRAASQRHRRRGRREDAAGRVQARTPEGTREGRWVLLDYVDIVVHIQHQEERNFYALDRLWRDCPFVSVNLDDVETEDAP